MHEPMGDSESGCSCTDSGRGTADDDVWGFFMMSRAASQGDVRETQREYQKI